MIEIKNVSLDYSYKNFTYSILKDISLKINENSFIFIKGASGIGKTSFFKILAGFTKQTSGHILIDSRYLPHIENPNTLLDEFRKNHMSFIFQDFKLINKYTVKENLLLPFKFTCIKKEKQNEIILNLLQKVNMVNKINFYPIALSGGEIQKVSILRALVKRPKVIIADEPFSNLDNKSIESILSLFISLHKENKISFLISTHHLDFKLIENKINFKIYEISNKNLNIMNSYD